VDSKNQYICMCYKSLTCYTIPSADRPGLTDRSKLTLSTNPVIKPQNPLIPSNSHLNAITIRLNKRIKQTQANALKLLRIVNNDILGDTLKNRPLISQRCGLWGANSGCTRKPRSIASSIYFLFPHRIFAGLPGQFPAPK